MARVGARCRLKSCKGRRMARPTPNFVVLDGSLPGASGSREPFVVASAGADDRGMVVDMLAYPRAQTRKRRGSEQAVSRTFYRLADEPKDTILVACSKCDWKAAFRRDELLARHGAACPMPSLLERLAAPGVSRSAHSG